MTPLSLRRDLRASWLLTSGFLRRHRLAVALTLLLTAWWALAVGFPNDPGWVRWIGAGKDKQIREIAHRIGATGSLAQYNIVIVIALWGIGRVRRSRYLQKLALVTFMTTVLAGAFCNLLRFPIGRARPHTGESHLTFKGPQFQARYHGFPSGHTSTAFGTAVPLLIAVPEVGVPATAFAAAMAWARVYDKQHYPTDVTVGAIIGIIAGIAGGWPMLRLRRRLKRAP
ncbi:MAG: phosphatase PAP2 family protein [Verrucomicrobia bacterium]|nr:phosphatase PAP2 family protein [Verrucomicrobiota bacterium]